MKEDFLFNYIIKYKCYGKVYYKRPHHVYKLSRKYYQEIMMWINIDYDMQFWGLWIKPKMLRNRIK